MVFAARKMFSSPKYSLGGETLRRSGTFTAALEYNYFET